MIRRIGRLAFVLAFCVSGWACLLAAAEPASPFGNPTTPWPATDGLDRTLPLASQVGPPVDDRFVGMFYFLWHNQRGPGDPKSLGPRDISRILAADPNALSKPDSPLWGGVGEPHNWGESLFGYYDSTDPWVVRRHAHLLADAGIDTLIFDATNALTYPEVYMKLCDVFMQIRKEGGRTPQIAFMVNSSAGETAKKLYDELYSKNLYPELWFRWKGKPLLLCDPEAADKTVREFFTLRRAHWPFTMVNTKQAWHWEATYPQVFGYDGSEKEPEQVSVSVAQNLAASNGNVMNMSTGLARGRSFHDGKQDTTPGAINQGHNFQEQWQRAFDLKPPFVLVTGWNEWWAMRSQYPNEPIAFVDQYNQEFSRDIEPMKGGHNDNYYMQLLANVRRFKGAPAQAPSPAKQTIDIAGPFTQWDQVKTSFPDHVGETIPRDYPGILGTHYKNDTGRNDIVESKTCRDAKNVYFWVRTEKPLSAATDPNWMWLLIDRDQNPATGWHGYDVIVNRELGKIEVNEGGTKWREVGTAEYRVEGNQLHLAIPAELLGNDGSKLKTLDFKWADNLQNDDDIMDFYLNGDVAPDGRFQYRATFE